MSQWRIVDPTVQADQAGRAPLSPASRKRARKGDVIKTYVLQWAVLETDSFATSAPMAAKDIAPDLCRALMIPTDRPKYDQLSATNACAELLGLLSMATPMAAAITDKVKDMQSGFAQVKEMESRAVKTEKAQPCTEGRKEAVPKGGQTKAECRRMLLSNVVKGLLP
ncbi:hypothetical protein POM88_031322 [Heracleum sosnowskyi]|uniref:Uncharacterized protein n=1 Tax=Heracleum sosnowskyi TaxID=360622 RepID=A0AAD8HX65_9APIA|nr:hypothetical protein POM88_031322 [Heracleum sosnowskyi]